MFKSGLAEPYWTRGKRLPGPQAETRQRGRHFITPELLISESPQASPSQQSCANGSPALTPITADLHPERSLRLPEVRPLAVRAGLE